MALIATTPMQRKGSNACGDGIGATERGDERRELKKKRRKREFYGGQQWLLQSEDAAAEGKLLEVRERAAGMTKPLGDGGRGVATEPGACLFTIAAAASAKERVDTNNECPVCFVTDTSVILV